MLLPIKGFLLILQPLISGIYPLLNPLIHLSRDPAANAGTDFYRLWKFVLSDQIVDKRLAHTYFLKDCRKANKEL